MTDRNCQSNSKSTPVYPWYKERLRTKCLKDPVQKQQLAGVLDGRRWRFLKPGLDDFRDGYPTLEDVTLTQPGQGTEPVILGLSSQSRLKRLPNRRFTKEQMCFSKQNCLQQMRRQYVDGVEQSLKEHPLALYPHLASGMPPELFYDALSVLDPAMCSRINTPVTHLAKQEESSIGNVLICGGPIQDSATEKNTESSTSPAPLKKRVTGSTTSNPYKWRKVKKTKEDLMVGPRYLSSLSEDEDVKKVTKLFCDWLATLGGETTNMMESTIFDLFLSGYEMKPPLQFPAQVITEEVNDVPCNNVERLTEDGSYRAKLKDLEVNKVHTSSTKMMWYLDPKSWKKRHANEPLTDPSATEDLELEQHHSEKDEELKVIHGTQAFKEFIVRNGLRMPQFLSALFSEEEQENKNKETGRTTSS